MSVRTFIYQVDLQCVGRLLGSKSTHAITRASDWLDRMLYVGVGERAAVAHVVRELVELGVSDGTRSAVERSLVDMALVALILGACPSRLLLDNWKAEGFETMDRLLGEDYPSSVVSRYWSFLTFGRSFPGVSPESSPAIYGYVLRAELGDFAVGLEAIPMEWRDRLDRDMRLLLDAMNGAITEARRARLDLFSLTD